MSFIYLLQHDCLSILYVLLLFQAFVSLPVCYFLLSSLLYPPHQISSQFFSFSKNFLHKDHSLGCVIPPSHTSSFPTILLSDEGRSSLPFPLFPYVFSALLPPHFLSLSLGLSPSFPLWVFVGWNEEGALSWVVRADLHVPCVRQDELWHAQTDIYIRCPTLHRPTHFALKKRGIRSGDAKNKVHAKSKRTRLVGGSTVLVGTEQ